MPRTTVKDRTQVLPFPEATDLHQRIARSFALITDWSAALAGHFSLTDVVAILTKQTEARNIALYRMSGTRVLPIATAARAYDNTQRELSSGAIAQYLMAYHAKDLEPGSVWRLRDLRKQEAFAKTPAAREWDQRPDIVEVCLIVLEATDTEVDFIEMIFDQPPRPSPELPITIVTQALADSWSVRSTGLITRLIRTYGRRRTASNDANGADILSQNNPCALSRAEQRVCQLTISGAKAREIAEALGVSIPTVRTHLRNIYAKTQTSGQVELIALINGDSEQTA